MPPVRVVAKPTPTATADGVKAGVLLAKTWDRANAKHAPTGWWLSEKLDGVRAYWDGTAIFSRVGNKFPAPAEFLAAMPAGVHLDGELYGGRGIFQTTVSIVRSSKRSNEWMGGLCFRAFDIPSMAHAPFEARMAALAALMPAVTETAVDAAHPLLFQPQTLCTGVDHLDDVLASTEALGGEGVMLRKAGSLYERKRSSTLLKVKTFRDADAVVVEHLPGKGKHVGRLGAVLLRMLPDGPTFQCGSGFTDAQRGAPPDIGAVVIYRFQELTNAGIPRFPTFVGERAE
jgi:DNA ligase-1